jgi:hypothetical protein
MKYLKRFWNWLMTPVEGPTIAERMISFSQSKWSWLILFYLASVATALMAGLQRGRELQKIADDYPYPQMYQAYMLDDSTKQLWSAHVTITNDSIKQSVQLLMPVEKDSVDCLENYVKVARILSDVNDHISWEIFVCRWPYQHYK